MMTSGRTRIECMTVLLLLLCAPVMAQRGLSRRFRSATNAQIIVPQSRLPYYSRARTVEITRVDVGVVIFEQTATTTMDISLRNRASSRAEAELLVPVPPGAVVRGFAYQGKAKEATARTLVKEEARHVYNSLVAKIRDPALLEFAGCGLVRTSVFPVGAAGTQKVRLTYELLLPADGNRIDYVLPRSESLEYRIPWKISFRIKSGKPISTVYSPSHELLTKRESANLISGRTGKDAEIVPGSFRLSYLLEGKGITASLLAYPDPAINGGYFLLLAGLPPAPARKQGAPAIKREVTLVIDRSGSMSDGKLQQVRESALQILAGLEKGEAFNLVVYNESVDVFSKTALVNSDENIRMARQYLKSVNAKGGTNIHDALVEALRMRPPGGMLPIVLFLTDGLPTIGRTSEVDIRAVAVKANPYKRRIFTLGVGVDVNTPLLKKLADDTRAKAEFVLPGEDVEVKVAQVFKRLTGPVLADPELTITGDGENLAERRVTDLMPNRLPDFFEGDQLVLLGRYRGKNPVTFRISGNYLGKKRTFKFKFGFEKATTRNAFIPRLWAGRMIAFLVDAIRQLGADSSAIAAGPAASSSPRIRELTDEIVKLSTQFGILTEYTAFLAREGTDLSNGTELLAKAQSNFETRAVRTRSGLGSYNQFRNNSGQMSQKAVNIANAFFDKNMNRVVITNVQQVNDCAFYRRRGRWVDSRIIVEKGTEIPGARVIMVGSEEFLKLAEQLARRNRQGCISLQGEILLLVNGDRVLIKGAGAGK